MSEKVYILKWTKVHNLPTLSKLAIHNFRQISTAAPNADYNLTHLNETLINPGREDYAALWKERQYEVNVSGGRCKPKSGAVYAYEIILGYTKGAIAEDRINEWAEANIEWLATTFNGKENILSAVLHLDETTPHIHAIVMPIDERNHLCARTFTGGRKITKELRATYTEAMKPFGIEAPLEYKKADNKALKKFYKSINVIVNTEAPKIMDGEEIEDYKDRCEEWVKTIEYRCLDEVNKAHNQVNELFAKQTKYNIDNKDVSHLNNLLMIKYCGNKKRAKKIIMQFTDFIDNVPISTLEQTMDFLKEKFIKGENILSKDISKNIENLNKEIKNDENKL